MLEAEFLFDARLAYMQTYSALHSHPNADIEKAGPKVNNMYLNAVGTIPYLTGGLSGDEVLDNERMALIDAFKAQQAAALKPKLEERTADGR